MKTFEQFIADVKDKVDVAQPDPDEIVSHYKKPHYSMSKSNNSRLGWSTKNGQYRRFKHLFDIGVEDGDSILDYGCGLGDMYDYINQVNYDKFTKYSDIKDIKYTGVDINNDFIEDAKKLYGDFFYKINRKDDIKGNFDWVLASGVFTVHTSNNMLYNTIDHLYNLCNKGVAFNLLDENNVNAQDDDNSKVYAIRGYDKKSTVRYFKKKYKNVKVSIDYSGDEFTIYIYK